MTETTSFLEDGYEIIPESEWDSTDSINCKFLINGEWKLMHGTTLILSISDWRLTWLGKFHRFTTFSRPKKENSQK